MKVTIEYNDPMEAKQAINVHSYRRIITDLHEFLHLAKPFELKHISAVLKDEGLGLTKVDVAAKAQQMALEIVRSHLNTLLENSQISLYDNELN